MKPRKAKDLRELSDIELDNTMKEAIDTLTKQNFQNALSQLHDTAYLSVLKKDIARINTIITERNLAK